MRVGADVRAADCDRAERACMRARVNDWLRSAIAHCVRVAGVVFSVLQQFRLRRFEPNQKRLKRKYRRGINKSVGGRFAFTSGSAGDPKRILYTNARLRRIKIVFSDMYARACLAFRIKDRKSTRLNSSHSQISY